MKPSAIPVDSRSTNPRTETRAATASLLCRLAINFPAKERGSERPIGRPHGNQWSTECFCAKLDWSEPARDGHAQWAHFYRELLEIRRRDIIPRLKGIGGNCGSYTVLRRDAVSVKWKLEGGARLGLVANLSNRILPLPEDVRGRTIWISNTD